MIAALIAFVVGGLLGTCLGVFVAALAVTSARADERMLDIFAQIDDESDH